MAYRAKVRSQPLAQDELEGNVLARKEEGNVQIATDARR